MVKLYNYQKPAIRGINHFNGRALIAYEMRLGKTFIALSWLKIHPYTLPTVIICPEIGKYYWEEKAKHYFEMRSVILNGTVPPKRKTIQKNKLYIINWDIIQYWISFFQKAGIKTIITNDDPNGANTLQSEKNKRSVYRCRSPYCRICLPPLFGRKILVHFKNASNGTVL